jgi:Type IV secretion-system coupling protein DNA-binding domain/TraM recognition site of TraD and TraG
MSAQSEEDFTRIGRVSFRNDRRIFGIRRRDRRSHMYMLGKTGTGKTTLLEFLVRQDMQNGEGLALFDPHGDFVRKLLPAVPESRQNDLVYLDATDLTSPLSFNPLESVPRERRSLAAQGLLEIFRKIWSDSWGPRMEHILRNCLFTLLDQPAATLADIGRLLHDKDYRKRALEHVENPDVRLFWTREYENYPWAFRASVIAPIENKVGAFLADPYLRKILTAEKSSLDLRSIMDEGKILLVNLAKGRIGEGAAALLGSLLVARIGLEGLARTDTEEPSRRDFYVYLDEFQTFATESLANMLSELRKYRVNLILANQYLAQLEEPVRPAILGNVGTLISFRLGPDDARVISREFREEASAADLLHLPNYSAYVKIMAGGTPTGAFSAETIPC